MCLCEQCQALFTLRHPLHPLTHQSILHSYIPINHLRLTQHTQTHRYNIYLTCYSIYKGQLKFIDALRVCLKMNEDAEAEEKITELFAAVAANVGEGKGQFPFDGQLVSGT